MTEEREQILRSLYPDKEGFIFAHYRFTYLLTRGLLKSTTSYPLQKCEIGNAAKYQVRLTDAGRLYVEENLVGKTAATPAQLKKLSRYFQLKRAP
jgi:hypothetical protein